MRSWFDVVIEWSLVGLAIACAVQVVQVMAQIGGMHG